MKKHIFFAILATGAVSAVPLYAATNSIVNGTNVRPVSQYGLIQNVQNYSSNPFWTKDSLYNQKFPQPVYVAGPELTSSDCQSTVSVLISSYCSSNNNCVGMMVSDVRPVIMLQLARMPGHNYATSCAGFIDTEFDSYVARYSIAVPNGVVTFPGATVANPNYDASEFKLENPYERHDSTWNGEEWQKEKKDRIQELKDLQAANGVGSEKIVKTDFPTTFADLSFTERMEVKTEGYEPFKDADVYVPFHIESEKKYLDRLRATNMQVYCVRRPLDPSCQRINSNTNYTDGSQNNGGNSNGGNASGGNGSGISREDMIQKIAAVLKAAKK